MASLNSVTLIGRLTKDPEIKQFQSGKMVANFDIAVDRRRNRDGDKETDFLPISAWDKLAEICSQYLTKGKLVCVQGRLQTRTYEKDGQKRKAFEILCHDMQMLSSSDGERKQSRSKQSDGYGDDVSLEDIPF